MWFYLLSPFLTIITIISLQSMDQDVGGAVLPGKKRKKAKNRETKLHLKFDDSKRVEFLTGFRKRKNERKEKAKKENERLLKEARAKVKQKNRDEKKKKLEKIMENFEKLKNSGEDDLSKFESEKQVFEDENTTVTVAAIDIWKPCLWIGRSGMF